MVKRTLRKTISAILAAAIAIGTIGINSIVRTEKINAEQITDEQVLSTYDTNKYIKDNYAQIISNKKYDEANIWGKGVVLLSDAQSSRGSGTNCRNCYSVNEDTVITYMDEKGNKKDIKNKNEDGTVKADNIYFGYLSGSFYNYALVGKDGKIGAIDYNGAEVSFLQKNWYDDIQVYNINEEAYYGLYTKQANETYKYEVVKEDGTLVFSDENVTEVRLIGKSYQLLYRGMIISHSDDSVSVYDMTGKKMYQGKTGFDLDLKINSDYKYFILYYSDSFVYINFDTGKVCVENGRYKRYKYICSMREDKAVFYNENMDEQFFIDGNWKYFSMYGDNIEVTDSNGKSIIRDSNGYCWPQQSMKFVQYAKDYNGAVFEDDNGDAWYYYNNGNIKKDMKQIRNLCNETVKNIKGVSSNYRYETIYNAGILYEYNSSGEDCYLFVSKESNFTDVKVLRGNLGYDDKGICSYDVVDKNIDINGASKTFNYRINKMYDFSSEKVVEKMPDMEWYSDSKNYSSYYYTEDGKKYKVNNNGSYKEITDTTQTTVKYIGDTGYYTDKIDNRCGLYDPEGNEVDINLDELYNDENNKNIDVALTNTSNEYPYFIIHYYRHNEDKSTTFYYNLYSYDGKLMLNNYKHCIKTGDLYIVICEDGTVLRLNNLAKKTLSDVVKDEKIKIDKTYNSDVKLVLGLSENLSAKDVSDKFDNVKICDKDGNELTNSDKVGTGCEIQLIKSGSVMDKAVVVIKGDTDGNGLIDVLDMELIQKSILGLDELTGVYENAALLSEGNNDISVLDIEAVQKDILGLSKINK